MYNIKLKRRLAFELCIFAVLVLCTALVLRPIQRILDTQMSRLRDYGIRQVEHTLGRTIRYGSASPSIIGFLDIREVSVFKEGESPVLSLDRIRIEYSLWDLIRGRELESIRSFYLENPEINIDLERDRDLSSLFGNKETGGEPRSSEKLVLPSSCLVRIINGTLILSRGEQSLRITSLNITGEVRDGRVLLDGGWHTEASWAVPGAGAASAIFVNGGITGNFASDFSGGDITVGISSVSADTFELRDLNFDVLFSENRVELRDASDVSLGLRAAYDFTSGAVSGSWNPDNVDPSGILRFKGPWTSLTPWIEGTISGAVSFYSTAQGFSGGFKLSGTSRSAGLGFALLGTVNETEAVFQNCELSFNGGTVQYTGDIRFNPLLPQGVLVFSGFSLTGNGAIDGTLRLDRSEQTLDVFAENFSLGQVVLSALSGALYWEDSGCTYSLEALRFKNIESWEDVDLAVLSMNGSYDRDPRQIQGSIALDSFVLGDLIEMAAPVYSFRNIPVMVEEAARRITVTTEVFISTDFEHVSYNAPHLVSVFEGLSGTFAVGSISGSGQRFDITGGRITWKNGSADLDLGVDFTNPNDISFIFQTLYKDFAYSIEGVFFNRHTLSIRGAYGFTAYIGADDTGGYSGYVNTASLPVPFRGQQANLDMDISVRYLSQTFWALDINNLELRSSDDSSGIATVISLGGQVDQDGLNLDRIYYTDRFGPLQGSAAAVWDSSFVSASGQASLVNAGGSEHYDLSASWQDKTARIRLSLDRVRLDRFMGGNRNAMVTGLVEGYWNVPDSYRISMNLESLSARVGEYPLNFSGSAYLDNDRLVVSAFRGHVGDMEAEIPVLNLNRAEATLVMSGNAGGFIKNRPMGITMGLEASFEPASSWFSLGRSLRSFSGVLNVESAYLNKARSEAPFSLEFSRTRDTENPALRIHGGPEDLLRFEWLESGEFFLALSGPAPIQGTISGTLRGTEIDAAAEEVFVDLPGIWDFMPVQDIIYFTGGFITGTTRITGSIFDPEFYGSAWGSSVRMSLPLYLGTEIGPGSGHLTLEGSEISFGPLRTNVETGMGTISASFRFNRWVPSFDVALAVDGDTPIPFDFNLVGFNAFGDASGELYLNMENNELITITGDLLVSNAELTINADEMKQAQEQGFRLSRLDVVTDVHITAGRRVEFIWPNANVPVLRAYGDQGTGVRVVGDTRIPQFTLDGDVVLRGGEIYYFQRSFYIREGQVFFNANEIDLDPRISARAEIRDRNDEGPVIISLIVDNAPLSNLMPRFESNPPLSQMEIYSFLGQNPEGNLTESGDLMWRTLTDVLAQFAVVRRVERQIRNVLGLDMFSVRTQILQNAVYQAVGPSDPTGNNSRMGNYFDNTTVFMGKYVGADLFMQTMFSFRYDPYRSEYGGVRLEPEIGLDMRTPLFDIRWNVSPEHPENLYMDDQSFSLIWHWSL